jgi:GNAT superfamily N-acetyltransferase
MCDTDECIATASPPAWNAGVMTAPPSAARRANSPSRPPLRLAGADDVSGLAELARVAYAAWEPVIGSVPKPMSADWSAVLRAQEVRVPDGALDASLALAEAPDHPLIWSIAVRPSRQHTGLGRELLAFVERRAAELGLWEVRLYPHARMTRNIALYERAGYVRTRIEDRGDRVVQHMAKPRRRAAAVQDGTPED